jgi:hypothetical protein
MPPIPYRVVNSGLVMDQFRSLVTRALAEGRVEAVKKATRKVYEELKWIPEEVGESTEELSSIGTIKRHVLEDHHDDRFRHQRGAPGGLYSSRSPLANVAGSSEPMAHGEPQSHQSSANSQRRPGHAPARPPRRRSQPEMRALPMPQPQTRRDCRRTEQP